MVTRVTSIKKVIVTAVLPDVSQQLRCFLLTFMSEAFFKDRFCKANLHLFPISLVIVTCFINGSLAVWRACVIWLQFASFISIWYFWVTAVMILNNLFHWIVGSTMVFRKMVLNNLEDIITDFCSYVFTKRWIKPDNIPHNIIEHSRNPQDSGDGGCRIFGPKIDRG